MEQNLPIVPKKFWSMIRAAYSLLRKRISKARLLADLNLYLMMKRGKFVGVGVGAARSAAYGLTHNHRRRRRRVAGEDEPQIFYSDDDNGVVQLEHFNRSVSGFDGEALTVTVTGSTGIRQQTVTEPPQFKACGSGEVVTASPECPLPLEDDVEVDERVDEAAEEFIMKFYRELRQQNYMAS